MDVASFVDSIEGALGADAYFGVPDSLLRAFTDEIVERYGFGASHVVAADEGGATALAAGHYLATGKPAVVYLQNSGIGNAVNPICSLLNEEVYAIPALFVVGWRGEPGVHDEPQHVFQGKCSSELLETIGLSVDVISADTTASELDAALDRIKARFAEGKSAALLVRKGALVRGSKRLYEQDGPMTREEAVEAVVGALPGDAAIVSTTGKLSRELFEIRERAGQPHERDFLTVGSMGHSSMIGLGIALSQPLRAVAVLDGDGACLMHAGALAVMASKRPERLVHVLFNNQAHESVGGMPTASPVVDWCALALASGYKKAASVGDVEALADAVANAAAEASGPVFVEARISSRSRADLGRPTTSARDNGKAFRAFLASGQRA